jgi:hypothetical protein
MIERNQTKARAIDATYTFEVVGAQGGGTWTVDLISDPPSCQVGYTQAQCAIEIRHEDFMTLVQADDTARIGMALYFQGKIKVTGDPMLTTKLHLLFGLE